MKKVFDQTVRDLKREVNKKVLKVPSIEQKVLDATSNEPWGPHGSLLADIAQATRNYHEYQIIMHVIWKRLNDTGKNWRHVYKALTVLEYLVGHGSERVIDDIREHAYQISTLSDFQYIDSSGKDQGSNVRRKSQSLVALVNDKEKLQEVRQKALINKDKYRSTFATGGRSPYSGSGSYGDRYDEDRSEGRHRDDDRNGYGRERDWGSRDDERYGRGSDSYNRDVDRYGRDSDDRYRRDSYRDDDYRGGRGNGNSQFGPRNRSFDRDRDGFSEEDDRYSSRHSGGRVEEQSQDERRLERKLSEQSPPPSYEETVNAAHDNVQDRRSVENVAPSGTKVYSPPAAKAISPTNTNQHPNQSAAGVSASASNKEVDEFDEFDPRGSMPAPASGSGVDFFGDQSASDPIHSLALVPVDFATTSETESPVNSGVGTNFVPLSSAPTALSQPSEDPFGDGPFRVTTQDNFQAQQHGFAHTTSFQPSSNMAHGAAAEPPIPAALKVETAPSFDFGDSLGGLTYAPNTADGRQHFASNPPPMGNEFLGGQVNNGRTFGGVLPSGPSAFVLPQASQQPVYPTNMHTANANYLPQPGPLGTIAPRSATQPVGAPYTQSTLMNLRTQPGLSLQPTNQTAHTALGAQPPKDKFETKSTVWSDTLNRGLVNLNISGAKVNPLADIGVDFDAINRMDKRKERGSAAPVTSTITMGKAMGSGSGIGQAGAGGIAPPPNPLMGSNTGIGMGRGMGMGGYGMGMNQPMGMGMGMNMNMGMNQGAPMHPPAQGPAMGMGGHGTQPYGGGYR